MAKELPFFKFEPNRWDNGNIQMLSREDKGLFMDMCSMYWSRLGDMPKKLAIQKLCGGNAVALDSLCEEKIIEIIDDNIYIKFLSVQLSEFEDKSEVNSKNARDGWEKRRRIKAESESDATALQTHCESDAIREEKRREEDRREEKREKKNFVPPSLSEVEDYFKEKGFSVELAKKAFDYYAVNDWKDSKNNQVKNWKQKMISVWLKDENKNNAPPPKTDRFSHNLSVMERTLIEMNEYDNEANR